MKIALYFLALSSIVFISCGSEFSEDVQEKEFAYKHGPPPGDPPWDYFLTSYGDPTDPDTGTPACGGKGVDGKWYYATGAYSFGCFSQLKLEANGKCVVVDVVDQGPAAWVEEKAADRCGDLGYIIDASPVVAKDLFNVKSAGWSDCLKIKVTPVAQKVQSGPIDCKTLTMQNFIGEACADSGACSTQECLTEAEQNFPGGMCSQDCDRFCPDLVGKAGTFCVTVALAEKTAGKCFSKCDYTLHKNGCRSGYECIADVPRHNESSVVKDVRLPTVGKGVFIWLTKVA